jgi:hypothetical protein
MKQEALTKKKIELRKRITLGSGICNRVLSWEESDLIGTHRDHSFVALSWKVEAEQSKLYSILFNPVAISTPTFLHHTFSHARSVDSRLDPVWKRQSPNMGMPPA